ncbi:ankyrin repeat domain-containing protein [Tessaracoccus massiliensis]|uniref:ankyrin repeat domain-containing protein n=1 Tax=Tessaracoccus massiliensis TaxID=1522311 RepID=UPI0009454286
MVRALVEHGAVDGGNPSALHYAAAAGEPSIVRLLLDHGADGELLDANIGMPPSAWAEYFRPPRDGPVVAG